MEATVAERGQITLPKAVRDALGLSKGTTLKVELDGGRYAVFAVTKMAPGKLDEVPEQQQVMLKQQLSQLDGAAAAKAYVDSLRQRFKVQVQESQL